MKKLAFSLLIFVPIIVFGQIINIPADYTTIQEGIDAANEGDTVLVQPDLYMEHLNLDGKNITLASLFLTTQDTNYIAQTVIDGDTSGRVMNMQNLGQDTKFVGFTLKNGNAHEEFGGGINLNNAYPIISAMIIRNNTAAQGGGIYCDNAMLNLHNVILRNNNATHHGGAIRAINSNLSLIACTISENTAVQGGAALRFSTMGTIEENFMLNIESSSINNNSTDYQTAGILIRNDGTNKIIDVHIEDSDFSDNMSGSNGALQIRGDSIYFSLINTRFIGNEVVNYAASLAANNSCSGELINCLFANNIAATGGDDWNAGGPSVWGGAEVDFINCTFTDNSASYGAGLTVGGGGLATALNCIFWGNEPDQISLIDYDVYGGTLMIDYCDVEEGIDSIRVDPNSVLNWGDFNIDEDPIFVGSGADPYALSSSSGCIDTGTPDTNGMDLPPYDLMGNVRVWDGSGGGTAIIDMGPYEYGAPVWVGINDNPISPQEEEISLYVYPNPCSELVHLRYEISERQLIIYDLYTITGKRMKRLLNEEQMPGNYEFEINVSDLSPGIYFIRLQSGDLAGNGKMILVR
ncbi:MAG: T9SS type A sorting domain-containing protein [Bacteroidales bacterium]|nr:T9SS type A sorting domain-containing protein [Bacteroidales bacterium]